MNVFDQTQNIVDAVAQQYIGQKIDEACYQEGRIKKLRYGKTMDVESVAASIERIYTRAITKVAHAAIQHQYVYASVKCTSKDQAMDAARTIERIRCIDSHDITYDHMYKDHKTGQWHVVLRIEY